MMAEEETKPQVELDTDDAKEQDVEVKEPEKKEEPKDKINLNVGEVDLGYTEHIDKDKEKAKILIEDEPKEEPQKTEPVREEKKIDDLEQVSKTVQKRIDKLTHRYREAERREHAALDFAKGLQKKYDHSLDQYRVSDDKYLKEFDARVDSQREQVKNKLKEAIEAQNSDLIMKANDELTQLAVEKEKARIQMAEKEVQLKEAKAQLDQPDLPQGGESMPLPSEKAKQWAQKNTWFGNDKVMTNAAWTLHEDLVGRGVDVDDDNYYNEIDRQMKGYFPDRFEETSTAKAEHRAPVQMVASAGRKQQGRRTVKLTKSQVAISKKLGVPLEEYAKYVKEEA
jgi:hypothetical protein